MGDDLDPFGRRRDENPLASLGWHGDAAARPAEPEPGPKPEPEPEPEPEPRVDRPVRPARSGGVRISRMVVGLALVLAVIGGLIGVLVDEGVERADRFVRDFAPPDIDVPTIPRANEERSPTQNAPPARIPRGLSTGSLLRPAAFGRAIDRLRTGGYGRLTNLRVAPDRIDATLLTKDGRLRQVQIVPGGAVRVIGTTRSGNFAGAPTMALKGIVASAPDRLTRSAAGRLSQPAGRVDYLVMTQFAGIRQWNVHFKGGQIFSGDARGRITRRMS